MPEIACRVLFNLPPNFPRTEIGVLSEMMNRMRSLDVVFDITIMSHGFEKKRGRDAERAVEVTIYKGGAHEEATKMLTSWLTSDGLKYRTTGDVVA
jgi:hypothetical protein